MILLLGLACLGVGVLTVFLPKSQEIGAHYLAQLSVVVGSALTLFTAGQYLLGPVQEVQLVARFAFFTFGIDGWGAYFLAITGLGGILTGLYGIGYGREYQGNRLRLLSSLFAFFVLSMVLVLLAQDAVSFLLAWEIMAIVSFLLVNHESEKEGIWQVAYQYLVMTQIGTTAIMIAFLLLSGTIDNMSFAALAHSQADAWTRQLAFGAAFLGFALKAGLIPLHVWLPNAHPAAPSHVSALMSGVMLKVALYGFGRFIFMFLGPMHFWWGVAVLVIGVLSAFVGALYASMATDAKRILAYSSVENMGIVFAGMGTGMLLLLSAQPTLAYIAFGAALVHAFNHSIMKGLLFMGAGAIMQSTGTKNIEKLGGLRRYMPKTALFLLAGSLSLSSIPLTGGFVGEWLTLQGFLQLVYANSGIEYRLLAATGFIFIGLAAALALGCFVRFYGIVFLGRPRTHVVEKAHEAAPSMLLAMGLAACLVFVFGIVAEPVWSIAGKVLAQQMPAVPYTPTDLLPLVPAVGQSDSFAPVLLASLVLFGFVLLLAVTMRSKLLVREEYTWNCGTVSTPRQQYSALGFSKPVRRAFGAMLKPVRSKIYLRKTHAYFGRETQFDMQLPDRFTDNIYQPLQHYMVMAAAVLRRIQAGSVRLYVSYVIIAMLFMLIWGAI